MHTPVLLDEVLKHVDISVDKKCIDCTLGEGGHSIELLKRGVEVLALDADAMQIERFKKNHPQEAKKMKIIQSNFAFIESVAKEQGFMECDVIFMDLGLSMAQMSDAKGLSYKQLDQPLDMVIDTNANKRGTARAADVVAHYSEDQLTDIFSRFGEIKDAKRIASVIVQSRKIKPITSVGDLVYLLQSINVSYEMPRVFQALRMEVNEELESLKRALHGALNVVRGGGKIMIITFHSIEDRVVKKWGKEKCQLVAKYVGRNVSRNSFEKSAVLRVYKK